MSCNRSRHTLTTRANHTQHVHSSCNRSRASHTQKHAQTYMRKKNKTFSLKPCSQTVNASPALRMATLLERTLEKKMHKEAAKEVLEFVEGFVPKGVDKSIWRSILARWQNTPAITDNEKNYADEASMTGETREHCANPTEVRKEIEKHNATFGTLQWQFRHANCKWATVTIPHSALRSLARVPGDDYLCATPPINKQLIGHRVCLSRDTRRGSMFLSWSRIVDVNDTGSAFQHTTLNEDTMWYYGVRAREQLFWCRAADVRAMRLEVVAVHRRGCWFGGRGEGEDGPVAQMPRAPLP